MRLDVSKGLSHADLQSPIGKYTLPLATAFHEEMTIEEVLHILRKRTIEHLILYFFSVDDNYKLTGILSTRDLLLADPTTKLSQLVDPTVWQIEQHETVENGLRLLEIHGLQAIPVVDAEGHLKGLFELIPERLREKTVTSKEVYQLIGMSLNLGHLDSTRVEFRSRMPWLLCNMLAGLICATIAATFTNILAKYVVLAMFIPLVLSLGESVAMQSMALSMQFLHFGKLHWKRLFKRIVAEWKTAALLGLSCACLVGSVFWIWDPTVHTTLAVACSIFFAMFFSTTLGSIFPIILHSLTLDPKVSSGPVVLMLTDIVVISTYLALSSWILSAFAV